jgi:hypothetical protein
MGFSQMVDEGYFVMMSVALTVNFIVKGVIWCNFYLFCKVTYNIIPSLIEVFQHTVPTTSQFACLV